MRTVATMLVPRRGYLGVCQTRDRVDVEVSKHLLGGESEGGLHVGEAMRRRIFGLSVCYSKLIYVYVKDWFLVVGC